MPQETDRYEVRVSRNRFASIRSEHLTRVPSLPSDSVLFEGVEGIDPDARSACVFKSLDFKVGDAVEAVGLHSESGQELNGRNGTVTEYDESKDMFKVKFALGMVKNRYEYKVVFMKASNLVKIEKNPYARKKLQQPAASSGPAFSRTSFDFANSDTTGYDEGHAQQPSYASVLAIGDAVEVFGLQSEKGQALNGLLGSVCAYDGEKDRYEVRLGSESDIRSLKASNLRRPLARQAEGQACGYI